MNHLDFSSAAISACPLASSLQQQSSLGRWFQFSPEGQFFTSKVKAAAFFHASVDTLDKWIARGMITPIKMGHIYFFPLKALAQAMNNPEIASFMKKKSLAQKQEKKRKAPHGMKVKYWLEPEAFGQFLFIRIRFKGINLAFLSHPREVVDRKDLEDFISDVIAVYLKCQTQKQPFSYENN